MPHDSPPACSATRPLSVITLAWPIGLLLLEATLLTPFVEFSKGGMALLASPHLLTVGIVVIATFFLIVVATEGRSSAAESGINRPSIWHLALQPWKDVRRGWLVAHLVILAAFIWLTLNFHARASTVGVSWPLAVGWVLAAAWVAFSLVLAFTSLAGVLAIVRHYFWQASVAVAIGMSLISMTPAVRAYWPDVDDPALAGLNVLLNIYPGQAIVGQNSNRWPIIGTPRMSLLVTPPCSELDSLLVFVLLAGTLWAAMGARLSAWKYLLCSLAGMAGLYALLSARLYFMILIGLWASNPYFAVKFAHSRISTLGFLLYTLSVLYVASRVARPTKRLMSVESMPVEEEEEEPASAQVDELKPVLEA